MASQKADIVGNVLWLSIHLKISKKKNQTRNRRNNLKLKDFYKKGGEERGLVRQFYISVSLYYTKRNTKMQYVSGM